MQLARLADGFLAFRGGTANLIPETLKAALEIESYYFFVFDD